MRKLWKALPLVAALGSAPAFAHHMAEDIIDDELWAKIDALVADTPHAELTLDDLGGSTAMTLTTPNAGSLADLLDDGVLLYLQMLGGQSNISIDFNADGSATLRVEQYQ